MEKKLKVLLADDSADFGHPFSNLLKTYGMEVMVLEKDGSKILAEKFVKGMSELSVSYITNETKITMQFLADIIKRMNQKGLINKEDLYKLSEKNIIEKIENCEYDNISKSFKTWRNTTQINESDIPVEDKYCVSINAKRRYINPLVKNSNDSYVRINQISDIAKQDIEKCLNFQTKKYAYFDFDF